MPKERAVPAVFHNAFRAPDGAEAVVLANATVRPQTVEFTWRGKARKVVVPAADAVIAE